jgi:hypothetical protein
VLLKTERKSQSEERTKRSSDTERRGSDAFLLGASRVLLWIGSATAALSITLELIALEGACIIPRYISYNFLVLYSLRDP